MFALSITLAKYLLSKLFTITTQTYEWVYVNCKYVNEKLIHELYLIVTVVFAISVTLSKHIAVKMCMTLAMNGLCQGHVLICQSKTHIMNWYLKVKVIVTLSVTISKISTVEVCMISILTLELVNLKCKYKAHTWLVCDDICNCYIICHHFQDIHCQDVPDRTLTFRMAKIKCRYANRKHIHDLMSLLSFTL